MKKSILLASLVFLFCSSIISQDTDTPATSLEVTISIDGDSIAAFAMLAAGEEAKETVILLHGLPGNERNLDLGQALRRDGRNVIYFNYRGAWGSQGDFTYSNCIADVQHVIDFFSTKENAEKYRVKPNSFILFGHSMGGGIALLSGATDDRVKKITIYSPAHLGTASPEMLSWVKSYVQSLFMLNVDPEAMYQDLVKNKDKYNALNHVDALATKDLLIFDENERNKAWIEQLRNVEYILMETDHSFSDKRQELIAKVTEWIND